MLLDRLSLRAVLTVALLASLLAPPAGSQAFAPPSAFVPARFPPATLAPARFVPAGFTKASTAQVSFKRDQTPLSAKVAGGRGDSGGGALASGATGGAAVHMLLGLGLVLALIYVLFRVLKRTADNKKKEPTLLRGDDWMSIIASTPLAPSRSLHLIRVGEEIVLVGSAEQGVTPLRVYSAEEARELRIEPRDQPMASIAPGEGGSPPGFFAALVESLRRRTAR